MCWCFIFIPNFAIINAVTVSVIETKQSGDYFSITLDRLQEVIV